MLDRLFQNTRPIYFIAGALFFYSLNIGLFAGSMVRFAQASIPLPSVVASGEAVLGTDSRTSYQVASVSANIEMVLAVASESAEPVVEDALLETPTASPRLRTVKPSIVASQKKVIVSTKNPIATVTVAPKLLLTPSSSPARSSSPSIVAVAGSLNADRIFDMVNAHRLSVGKSALVKDDRVCSWVKSRAPQIPSELFGVKKMHEGFRALKLPYWATENIASYLSEEKIVNWWLNDAIHRKGMESDYKYSCVACSGRACSQIFTSFVAK